MRIKNDTSRKKISTLDWLCYHFDKATGKPFLSYANQCAAEKFSILYEKLFSNYRLSSWQTYVDSGHTDNEFPLQENARRSLLKAIKVLGDDASFTADIILKSYTLPKVEKKYKMQRGKAKIRLREALDRLAENFGIK